MEEAVKWQRPDVADHKVVRDIVGRKGPSAAEISEIDPLSEPGRIIDCLRIRVCRQKREIGRSMFHCDLSRVVVRIRDI